MALRPYTMSRRAAAATQAIDIGGVDDKIARILSILDKLYPPPVPIPLNHSNPYQLLVAVVLSAQTTDGAVNNVTDKLFEKVKTPSQMSALGQEGIADAIKTLGLYQNKSKFLYNMAIKLLENPAYADGSTIPNNKAELLALPGVGDKTASVVLSQVFQIPNLAVDTHVHRLALRWGLSKEKTKVETVKADLEAQVPRHHWNKVHLQMIYFGREYCPAKGHDSHSCPVCSMVSHGKEIDQGTPASPSKGIVFYAQRKAEIELSPGLTQGVAGVVNSPLVEKKKRKRGI